MALSSCCKWLMSDWISRAKRTAQVPASVGTSPRLVRMKSGALSVDSSSFNALLAPGCVSPTRSAAASSEPCSATAISNRSCLACRRDITELRL